MSDQYDTICFADPRKLWTLPDEAFLEGPNVLQKHLPRLFQLDGVTASDASALADMLRYVVPCFDSLILGVWIRSGGPLTERILALLSPGFAVSSALWEDGLLRHCQREDYLMASLPHSHPALRSNVRLMSGLVEQCPQVFALAAPNVQRAIADQVRSYQTFHFWLGRMIEKDDPDEVDEYENIIAAYLGSTRLRHAISLYHETVQV